NSRTNVSGTPNGESPRDKFATQLFNEGPQAIERRQIMVRTPILHEVEHLRRQWGWLLALGIGMVVLGAVAFSVTPAATLAAVLLFGWLLVISGLVEAIHAFRVRRWAGTFLHLIAGILGIFAGLLVVTHPVAGALAWTLMFAS